MTPALTQLLLNGYDTDTTRLFLTMTAPPTASDRTLISGTIRQLKAANVWGKIGVLTAPMVDAQAQALNWINPAKKFTPVNSPAYVSNRGWTGNGTNTELTYDDDLNTISVFTQDSATLGIWVLNNVTEAAFDIAAIGDDRSMLNTRNAGNMVPRANASASNTAALSTATSVGFSCWTRRNSANYGPFKDAVNLGTVTQTSSAVGAGRLAMLRSLSSFSTKQAAGCLVASGLQGVEITAIHQIMLSYYQAKGAL